MIDVLHINSYYESSVFYKGLFEKQRERGCNLKVYVPSSGDKKTGFEYGEYTDISYCFSQWNRVFFHLKHNKILKDIKRKYDFSTVKMIHAHSLFSNGYIAYKLKKEYGIPYIVAVRNTDVNVFFAKMIHLRGMGLDIIREAQKVVFISESYYEILKERYIPKNELSEFEKKSVIIPNGVNQYFIEQCGEPKKIEDKKKLNFLYVGEVNANKNVEFTVKCLQNIKEQKNVDLSMRIIGRISDQKVFDKIKGYEFVEYCAPMKKEALIKQYRYADIFVMPSITETFGLVYVEAMSQGTPLIYTKKQGFDKQFPDGAVGYPIDPNSYEEFEKAIDLLVENYSEISKNCIEGCKKFSWERIEKTYAKIYAEKDR